MRFDHPVWMIAKPGEPDTYLVVEQQQRKVWQLRETETGMLKTLFADLSDEAITGQFEGVMCLAFHPDFLRNGKYYLNYHVREDGIFSPVIAERVAAPNRSRDAGGRSRRILKIDQPTELHWGGMLASPLVAVCNKRSAVLTACAPAVTLARSPAERALCVPEDNALAK